MSPAEQGASTLPAPPCVVTTVCSCCWRSISAEEWAAMPALGRMDDGDGGQLELRNHACGSTLSMAVPT